MKRMDEMIRWEANKQLTKFTYQLDTDGEDEWDDQMRGHQTIDQVHVHPGDGWRGWYGIIRWEVFKQLTKFTYELETDEEDGMGWSDERSSNNWPSSRTSWRQMKRMGWDHQMRTSNNWPSSRTFWRRIKRMMRWELFKQLTKFTYFLETDAEDRMRRSYERSSNNWPNSRTHWRRMKRMDGMIR